MITRDTFNNQFIGLSTDNWDVDTNPVLQVATNGNARYDMDTKKAYMLDISTKTWLLQ